MALQDQIDECHPTGGCQCGAVRYQITGCLSPVYACHCLSCRKQSASAFALSMPIRRCQLEITSGDVARFSSQSATGRSKAGVFCRQCGTRLWHEGEGGDYVTVKAGTLDSLEGLAPIAHLWVSRKLDWVLLPQDVAVYETQPEPLDAWRRALLPS